MNADEDRVVPSHWQEYVAGNGLWYAWLGTCSVFGLLVTGVLVTGLVASIGGVVALLLYVIYLPIGAALGFLIALVLGSVVFPTVHHVQGLLNGAPFKTGDRVLVIENKTTGIVTKVDPEWIPGGVGVDVTGKGSLDVFRTHQLLRLRVKQTQNDESTR